MSNKPELRAELKRLKNAKALLEKRIGQVTAELNACDRDRRFVPIQDLMDEVAVVGKEWGTYPTESEMDEMAEVTR